MATCNNCGGTGKIEFSKERGGPVCPECGGSGALSQELIQRYIAEILDHPSVYMGGPSRGNLARADKIVKFLVEKGIV